MSFDKNINSIVFLCLLFIFIKMICKKNKDSFDYFLIIFSTSWILLYIIQSIYAYKKRQGIFNWFQKDALMKDSPLHARSGWGYLSTTDFNDITDDWLSKMNPPIKDGDSCFEMGCGVGAVLDYINSQHNNSLTIGGSDFSPNAIEGIKDVFNKTPDNFFILNMVDKHPVKDNSQDHVISAGALGMYLYRNEMVTAIKEAVRMTKPGGSLCFTHFLEKNGDNNGSIIDRVDKSFWIDMQDELGIKNIQFGTLKHQGDRYYFTCTKK